MLIFVKGHYLPLIASGQKTTTIRPWKSCKLGPGDPLSFNGKIRVIITQVEQRRLSDLTDADAHRDGFVSRRAFVRAFHKYYPDVSPDVSVWVLHFTSPS